MKKMVVERWHRWRGMYNDGFMVPVFWRASLSVNEYVDDLKKLPAMGGGFEDKAILLSCEKREMPMPTKTSDDWQAFEEALARERPAFAHFLDREFQIPSEMQCTPTASRYGFDVFHHPRPMELLFEQEQESSLLYILDHCLALYPGNKAWGADGKSGAELLHKQLTEDEGFSDFRALARKTFTFTNACGTFLRRLSDKYPQRIKKSEITRPDVKPS